MPSSHLNLQVCKWCGVENGQKFNRLMQGKYFLWIITSNSLTENEEHDSPSQILKTILDCMPQLFLDPKSMVSSSFVGSSDPKL